jgi:hypothetical protein
VKTLVAGSGDFPKGRSSPGFFELFFLGSGIERDESLLQRDREWDEEISRVVLVDPGLDLGKPLVLLANVIPLAQVDEVDDGLGGKELKPVNDVNLSRRNPMTRGQHCSGDGGSTVCRSETENQVLECIS